MPLALMALAGWSLFAFAGAYRWTIVPLVLGAAAMALTERPRLLRPVHRITDALLAAALAGAALQLVPLPSGIRNILSPAAVAVHGALDLDPFQSRTFRPLSLDPAATAWSLATALSCVCVFWIARATFERRGGIGRVAHATAWCGIVLAATVFVQRASSPHLIYGFWAPIVRTPHPTPLGPFVNRNDLATWLLLAIPLVLGYAIGRGVSRVEGRTLAGDLTSVVDARMVVVCGSVVLMSAALVASLSRSGLVGVGAGVLAVGVLGRRRLGLAGSAAFAGAMLALLVVALQYTNTAALAARLGHTLAADVGDRVAIWRQTWAMAHDFMTAGVGVGAFERGMLVYQQGSRVMFVNHAHNEYLQMLTEGGLLVAIPALLAAAATTWSAARHLRVDTPRMFWIRAGALGGLLAVGVQCFWDTGLRMPASAVLFALVAAVAAHQPPAARRPSRTESRDEPRPADRADAEN